MSSLRVTFRFACCLAAMFPGTVRGQSGAAQSVAPGTFIGRDSLDTRDEPSTPSRVRSRVTGTATWTIELDSLDLRRKFTIRIELPAPSPVTVVFRAVDSLPPNPGGYKLMLASTGASHGSRSTFHGDVHALEGDRARRYWPIVSSVFITSITKEGGEPVVSGRLELLSDRYADGKPGQLVFPYVFLRTDGNFAAHAATDPRPRIAVSPAMQEAVLTRALDGFMITHSGAINGDGDVDSTRQTALARKFLESRWRDAAIVERVDVRGMKYQLRLRGRHAPVVCESESAREHVECTTLPPAVSGRGQQGGLSGRVALRLAPYIPGSDAAVVAHLLPNPAPLKDAYKVWCDRQERADSITDAAFEVRLNATRGAETREAEERRYIAAYEKKSFRDRKEYRRLFASFAVQHATAGPDGLFRFTNVPAGNYLLFAALPTDDRIEWYLPIVMNGDEQLLRDLDVSNVNRQGWACGTPLPFPALDERKQ